LQNSVFLHDKCLTVREKEFSFKKLIATDLLQVVFMIKQTVFFPMKVETKFSWRYLQSGFSSVYTCPLLVLFLCGMTNTCRFITIFRMDSVFRKYVLLKQAIFQWCSWRLNADCEQPHKYSNYCDRTAETGSLK
jgi:hypothetical protein